MMLLIEIIMRYLTAHPMKLLPEILVPKLNEFIFAFAILHTKRHICFIKS